MPKPAIDRLLALGGELAPPAAGEPRRKYDLAHMRTLLAALGDPQLQFPSVLIAGTNGKGSTAATLASILQAAGHRTGLYTSPHLEEPHERIRINGEVISDQDLTEHFLHVETISARLVTAGQLPYAPSFFETITAIAFLHFAGEHSAISRSDEGMLTDSSSDPDKKEEFARYPDPVSRSGDSQQGLRVSIAILEVGMGGRLDATNVVDPLASILTDISIDHASWLGSTIAEITREKAGILRQGGTLITLPQHPEANQTIGEVAVPLGVHAVNAADYLPPRHSDRDQPAPATLADALRNRYSLTLPFTLPDGDTLQVDSPLAGAHQQRNIALAIAAAITLQQQHGFSLSIEALKQGIRTTHWLGRLQLLSPPLDRLRLAPVLLDAAHNPAGAWALRATLSQLPVTGPRTLVFGCMADKAVGEIAQILFPVFDEVLLTRTASPRAAAISLLVEAAETTGASYRTLQSASAALDAATAATPSTGLVVVAGSISLLGECSEQLRDWR